MERIIFCIETMILGGVEKELISVLKKIHDHYNITLLLLYESDANIPKEIPIDINIINLDISKKYYCGNTSQLVHQRIYNHKLGEAISICIKRALCIGITPANTDLSDIPQIDEYFDIAICYHVHSPLMLKYVSEKINSKKKIGWIHSSFISSNYKIQRLKKYINQYDEFVAVSKKVENEFRTVCPWYKGTVSTAYNYVDSEEIITLSNSQIDDCRFLNENNIKLLTVGRFSEEKGIDNAIFASSILKSRNVRFHWFIIGYGALENTYNELIKRYNVADYITILGKKTNPYPYIKHCDIYVQPSRHEAYSLTVLEAKILRKPIICTSFNGADEQIISGVNGIIVPLNNNYALAENISALILSPEKRISLSKSLEKWSPMDDLAEIEKHFQ